jgi:hypothetical protein
MSSSVANHAAPHQPQLLAEAAEVKAQKATLEVQRGLIRNMVNALRVFGVLLFLFSSTCAVSGALRAW